MSVNCGELMAATRAFTQEIAFKFITINHSILIMLLHPLNKNTPLSVFSSKPNSLLITGVLP